MSTKRFLALLGTLTFVISLPLTVILVQQSQEIRKSAMVTGGKASLSLLSSKTTLSPGEDVDLTLNLNTGGEFIFGYMIYVTYNSNVLEPRLTEPFDTASATLVFNAGFKNETPRPGLARLERSIELGVQPAPYVSGVGTLGTLKLRAKSSAALGATTIGFSIVDPEQSVVINKNIADTLGQATGKNFTVQTSLSLTANFEVDPSVSEVRNATVKVGGIFQKTDVTFTKSGGVFTASVPLVGVASGTYDVSVKGPKHLSRKLTGITIPRTTPVDFTTHGLILGGDLNGDNQVKLTDVGILVPIYGTTDIAADINLDGKVNMYDVGYLITNYNLVGE